MDSDKIFHSYLDRNYSTFDDCNRLPRYRWYNYKEGFSPRLVEVAINESGFNHDDYILDPFNGIGTVTLTASRNNIKSIGIEVNPFAAFVSKVKLSKVNHIFFNDEIIRILESVKTVSNSNLLNYSTFTEMSNKPKWLFNSDIIKSFESGWNFTKLYSKKISNLVQLALISAAMDNCNAVKDGKCLKYRNQWENREYNAETFIKSLHKHLCAISIDLDSMKIKRNAKIINEDSRIVLPRLKDKFKLCITSPPYLNSFDYTDIYRPELFLGKFITKNNDLRNLRYKTIRSHMEISLPKPKVFSFGELFNHIWNKIIQADYYWDKQIPIMIQCYFEDMQFILKNLKDKALCNSQLWLIVANSVYVGVEIPVDLILAEIGTKLGWKLKRIEVLRNINRRKTKYNGDIDTVRESLIIFYK